jgi:hypothetical protein
MNIVSPHSSTRDLAREITRDAACSSVCTQPQLSESGWLLDLPHSVFLCARMHAPCPTASYGDAGKRCATQQPSVAGGAGALTGRSSRALTMNAGGALLVVLLLGHPQLLE